MYAAKLIAIVSAVTMPGVNGRGNDKYAVTQHRATHNAIFESSVVPIVCCKTYFISYKIFGAVIVQKFMLTVNKF